MRLAFLRTTCALSALMTFASFLPVGSAATQSTTALVPTTVTVLDPTELHESMAFVDGFLWVGRNREQLNPSFRVDIFNRDGQLAGQIQLGHSAAYLYPYGAHSVLVVGTSGSPNLTGYTIITQSAGKFTAQKRQVPMSAWATEWIGTLGGREYFTDPGGNINDPEAENNINLAAQTIFGMGSFGPSYLGNRLRMPLGGIVFGSSLFVIHGVALGSPQSNMVEIHSGSTTNTPFFASYRNGLFDVTRLGTTNFVAVSESGANQILTVDGATKTLVDTQSSLGEMPRSLASAGKCLFVGNRDDRSVQVFTHDGQGHLAPLTTVPIDLGKEQFHMLDKVAVDLTRSTVYARSNFPCNPAVNACDQNWNRVVAFVLPAEISQQCQ